MSWARRTALAGVALALGLSACQVRPLYGSAPEGGTPVRAALPAISVDEPETRPEQVFRNALLFGFTGGGAEASPLYRLEFRMVLTEQPLGVEPITGTPTFYQLSGRVAYLLEEIGTGNVLLTADAAATASYNRSSQAFANVRATRDAEDRVANALARQVETRLATYFATRAP